MNAHTQFPVHHNVKRQPAERQAVRLLRVNREGPVLLVRAVSGELETGAGRLDARTAGHNGLRRLIDKAVQWIQVRGD